MLYTFTAGLRETNAVFLVMFAISLLVFNIGIFNPCGTLLSNLCTTSIGIMLLGRGNLQFISYILFVFTFHGVLIETTVMECGLNFILPLFLIIGSIVSVGMLCTNIYPKCLFTYFYLQKTLTFRNRCLTSSLSKCCTTF